MYYRTIVTRTDHGRNQDNWPTWDDESFEVTAETKEELHAILLDYLKNETEEDSWGDYRTYSWGEITQVEEIDRFIIDRSDVIGYSLYLKEKADAKQAERLTKEAKQQALETAKELALLEQLKAKYPEYGHVNLNGSGYSA